MMVELRDEVMIQCMDHTQGGVIKGKRTKRPRPLSPTPSPSQLTLSIACNSSNTAAEDCSPDDVQVTAADDDHSGVHEYRDATTSYRVSSDELSARSIDVEEDMANCLILLARGQRMKQALAASSDHTSAPSNGNKVGGSESYQCKTCNRCFPSFQALGGHRASHKKPKAVPADDKKSSLGTISSGDDDHAAQPINPSTTLSLEIPARVVQGGIKSKIHECSICRAEFTSGQALGGHMRRHRTLIASASPAATIDIGTTSINFEMHEAKKPKNGLHLDLNLPAPEDRESSIQSSKTPKQQVLVFSASSLVDCYY